MNQKSKLTFGKIFERFSYGCGDFGCNIIYTAMSAFLLFSVSASWASTPKLVYVFITYNLVSTVIYTAINVPYSALNALMTQDPYERSVLSIFRNLLATAGTLTINTFTLPLVEYFGNNAAAWTKTFVVFGFVAVAAFLCTFFGTKERVRAAENEGEVQTEDVPFVTGIKALFKNKYWIMMTGMLALFFLMYSVNGGATVYYAKDILGDKNLVSTINGIFNIVQICGMFFIAMLVKKFGKRNVFALGLVLDIVGMLVLNFSGGSMAIIVVSSVIRGIGNACVGYKIGNGIGSALLGLILEIGGYVGTAAVQTESALTSIKVCFVWIPILVYACGLVIMKFYHLDKEFDGIIADLKARAQK